LIGAAIGLTGTLNGAAIVFGATLAGAYGLTGLAISTFLTAA
tara:strand:- start:1605 stop:1730 length:126 start_codon:yes stop_codon:yes gene_type:complete